MKTIKRNILAAVAAIAAMGALTGCAGWDTDVGLTTGPYYTSGGAWTTYPYYSPFYTSYVPSSPPIFGNGPGSISVPMGPQRPPHPQRPPQQQPIFPQQPTPQPNPGLGNGIGNGNGQRPGANFQTLTGPTLVNTQQPILLK